MSFNDLVRRLHEMETGGDGAGATAESTKPVEELDPDRRAVKETANVLRAFNNITESKAPSAEIVDDRDEFSDESPEPRSRAAQKPIKRPDIEPDEDALDPVVESSQYDFNTDEVVNEDDDISSAIRQRFSQFMQDEVRAGADIDTISNEAYEASDNAKRIHSVFSKMKSQLEALRDMTEEGGKLYRAIESDNGDTKQLAKANKKLDEALAAVRKSHTYAWSQELPTGWPESVASKMSGK